MNNSQGEPHQDTKSLSAADVADYLRNHSDFFNDFPELLAELEIPHDRGEAVSLFERQLTVLREQNQQAKRQLHELIEIARQNEELARRMHQLALTLMDSAEPRDIINTLYDNLRKNFSADRVVMRLFVEPAFIDTYAGEEFAGADSPAKSLFKAIIDKRQPLSGRLKHQQQVYLFGDEGDDIASAVMVPLHGEGWGGILAIGSFDAERFQPGMGVELLANLGDVLSFVIKPWVREH